MSEKVYPEASISGVCTASSTILSLSVAFLGLWAFASSSPDTPWGPHDHLVVILAFSSFILLGVTPLIATAPRINERSRGSMDWARRVFALGLLLDFSWIAWAVYRSF